MLYDITFSQTHSGIEQYYYTGTKGMSAIVPKAYYQSKKGWYGEVRYNYEEPETFSLNAGKTFSKEGKLSYTLTPIAGLIAGKLNGASVGLNATAEYKKMFFSAESQYIFLVNNRKADFFFNWSEAGYQVTGSVFCGLSLQVTHLYKTINNWEPGIMAGFSLSKWTFPFYLFNPAGKNRYFVIGINVEWAGNEHKSGEKMILLTEKEQ